MPPRKHPQNPSRSVPGSPQLAAGRIRLYGQHAVAAALANPERRCRRLTATTSALDRLGRRLQPGLDRADLAIDLKTAAEISRMVAAQAVHQGLVLNADPLPRRSPEKTFAHPDGRPVVVLDRVTDPQNVGAVLRSSAAFGASALVLLERHAPAESGALAKAASGALEMVPIVRVKNLANTLGLLKKAGYWCAGLDPAAEDNISREKQFERLALVLGAEGAGLRPLTRRNCDVLLRLPLCPGIESLNVAAAAAVALFALQEQRAE